jgi:hypothetical protein
MTTRRWAQIAAVAAVGFAFGLSAVAWTAERHPHIQAAMKALERAEHQLQQAAHGYGGHRVKAMDLIRQAQQELREGLAYDRQHEGGAGKKGPAGQSGGSTTGTPSK